MKFWIACLAVALLVLSAAPARADVNDFVVQEFSAQYYLDRDERGVGNMLIAESIVARFPNFDQNHGIERAIPETYNDYDLNIDIVSVTKADGSAWNYTTYTSGGHLVIRIGDADRFVRGEQTYNIAYAVENVIEKTESQDQFFWDINGTGWSQVFEEVNARVIIPAELAGSLNGNIFCFSGSFGSTSSDCQLQQRPDGEHIIVTASAEDLLPGENLSIQIGFSSGTFYKDPWPLFWKYLNISMIAVLPLATLVYMVKRWRKYGRDPKGRGVIIPQYVPPKGFNPLSSDVMMHERLSTKAISAGLIDMAVSGHIKIHEKTVKKILKDTTEYELELVSAKKLNDEQKKIINALFDSAKPGARVKINDKANKLHSAMSSLQKSIPKQLYELGFFKSEPSKARKKYAGIGAAMLVVSFLLLFFSGTIFIGFGLAISGIIVLLFANAMPVKTKAGVEMRDYLRGLKDYMELAEAERIKYLQSPEGVRQYGEPGADSTKLHLFEKLLPYAMLFGIEEEWAKQFENLYERPPEWYSSNTGSFNSVYLARSLNSFSTSTTTAFSPPASSGSSGGSFSGGGGGGGGGGGW